MSATLAMKNIKIRAFGSTTTVPKNAIAKMMYYLHCVSVVIDYHDLKLTNYKNYDEIKAAKLLEIYVMAKLLNPSLFIEKGIFIVDKKLIIDADNQFYEITNETIGLHASKEIVIEGKTVKVLKLMACNDDWLSRHYFKPINEIEDLVNHIKIDESRNYHSQIIDTQTSIRDEDLVITKEFKCCPVTISCPFCRRIITTKTKSKFCCCALCCFLTCTLLYFPVQLCYKRNIFCCNIAHKCPNCGRIIGYYNACED